MVGYKIQQYEILKKLNEGGQGIVYKALDTKLDRSVVIKVLPPELTSKAANFARFEREAKLCSQLDHPNICTIYGYHEDNGTFYIVMQYIDGKNIRELVNGRALELESALQIQLQTCDALAFAHDKNIIHRDIKAGNVMINKDGQVKILDFGLAKFISDDPLKASVSEHIDITEIGVPYGTATYAAPEQAKGEETDRRTDIFSSGVLLYEMLTGIWAFQGKTVVDVRHQVLYGTPTPLAEMRPDPFPPKLQEIVNRSLEKDPKDRYQNISEMCNDLQGVLHEISGLPLSQNQTFKPKHLESANPVKRAWHWITRKSSADNYSSGAPAISVTPTYTSDVTPTTMDKGKKTVAILPFKNLSRNPETDYYEFALADSLITELAQIRSLIVRPSSIISKYQSKDVDPKDAGRELRAQAVLSAGFISAGEKIRVTPQLVDVASGDILWSDLIDAEGEDILALQDTISQQILSGLRLELSDEEQEILGRHPTSSAEAYEEYLQGRDNFGRFIFRTVSAEDCDAAIENFRKAIRLDPKFALAHSGLGACFVNRVNKGIGDADDYSLAEKSFKKAFKYDPLISEARVLMVMIYLARDGKKTARSEIIKLIDEFPNESQVYFIKGIMHRLDGEYDASLRSFQRLYRLDPAALAVSSYNRARIFIYRSQYNKALKEIDKGVKAEPNHPMLKIFRSFALFHRGDVDEAINLISSVLEENPQMEGIRPMYAIYLAHSGQKKKAYEQISEEAKSLSKADHDMAYWMGSAYALLGEKEEAIKWLKCAVKLGNENKPWFENDKTLDSLRGDERFIKLINDLG